MGVFQTMPISFGHFPSENPPTFPAQEPGKIPHFRRYFMKTGLNKRQKTTAIYLGAERPNVSGKIRNPKNRCGSSTFLPWLFKNCGLKWLLTTCLTTSEKCLTEYPGLAKFGIALDLGSRDRGFKSRSPDQNPASFHYENWRVLFVPYTVTLNKIGRTLVYLYFICGIFLLLSFGRTTQITVLPFASP